VTMKCKETVLSDHDRLRKWRRRDEETIRKICLRYEESGKHDVMTEFLSDLDGLLIRWLIKN
jgi:hypothetical protein